MLSDLRESGSLEQDADIVLFLCRDDFCRETEEDPIRLMELIVAKHRNGPVGKVELFFYSSATSAQSLLGWRKPEREERLL